MKDTQYTIKNMTVCPHRDYSFVREEEEKQTNKLIKIISFKLSFIEHRHYAKDIHTLKIHY